MSLINITENAKNEQNLYYIQSSMAELFTNARCVAVEIPQEKRIKLVVDCPDYYIDIVRTEIIDKIAEIIVIKYKYDYFKSSIEIGGLSSAEKEILLASLIAADIDDDKKFAIEKLKGIEEIAIDGVYNFRLKPLKKKWEDIVSYMPTCFMNSQLKEFVTYLLENKKKRIYIDCGKVYDQHYRRLKRSSLLSGEKLKIIREVLLSNCGEIEITGAIPKEDEKYIKEFYGDKLYFSNSTM